MKREPAITVGTITALATAVLALLAVFGLQLDSQTSAAILGVVAAAAPLVAAIITRRHVTPVAAPRAAQRGQDGRVRPLLALLAAAVLTVGLVGVLVAPAHADTQVQKCWSYDDGSYAAKICLVVNYSGHSITAVQTKATGDLNPVFETKIEDCDNLRLWNDNETVVWRKDDAQCDLTRADPSDTWYPSVTMPQSDHAHFGWTFYPKLDFAHDPGYTHISLEVTF